jgi:hypothetical protein
MAVLDYVRLYLGRKFFTLVVAVDHKTALMLVFHLLAL